MQALSDTQANNNEFLKENCPISVVHSLTRVASESAFSTSNWFSAIDILRSQIGEVLDKTLEEKKDWEQRAISLQKELKKCDSDSSLNRKVKILTNFLKIEIDNEKNEDSLSYPVGRVRVCFQFSLLSAEIEETKNNLSEAYNILTFAIMKRHL